MKSALALSALAFIVAAQACGSDDGSKDEPRKQPPTGQAGEASAGESSSGGTGGSGGTPSAGSGGTPPDAGSPGGGTAGTPNEGGNANEGGRANEGGSAGESTSAGAGGQAGALGEGGASGASEVTCEVAPTCTGTLANLGTGDFSISLELTTSTTARSGVISQRSVCMRGKFWDVRLAPVDGGTSSFSIEFDDGANYTSFVAKAPASLNDGNPHDLRVCRKSGTVYAFSDGVLIGSAASKAAFTTLPALTSLTTTCKAYDGTVNLVGTVEDICVGAL